MRPSLQGARSVVQTLRERTGRRADVPTCVQDISSPAVESSSRTSGVSIRTRSVPAGTAVRDGASAAAPATWGVAIDVPDMVVYASQPRPPDFADTTSTPGAAMSG